MRSFIVFSQRLPIERTGEFRQRRHGDWGELKGVATKKEPQGEYALGVLGVATLNAFLVGRRGCGASRMGDAARPGL